ncbi:hypothetical protein [Hazenella coriacea]|uniref:Uncharacterized protein n=1 Tax=Hazenella coriacea TaxID=1179467 RepID=A0A4R3L1W0_9BACL|nr:hypothetical protein [Hazenella coriacea]TCS93142.1 hypothetical protein EDD58_10984 [Hazenella coriacea]
MKKIIGLTAIGLVISGILIYIYQSQNSSYAEDDNPLKNQPITSGPLAPPPSNIAPSIPQEKNIGKGSLQLTGSSVPIGESYPLTIMTPNETDPVELTFTLENYQSNLDIFVYLNDKQIKKLPSTEKEFTLTITPDQRKILESISAVQYKQNNLKQEPIEYHEQLIH